MKKIILILVILIIAALVALPFYFGMKAEKKYNEIIANITESGNVTVNKQQFIRGLFHSKANTSLEIINKSKQITINSDDDIVHGPVDFLGLKKGTFNLNTFIAKVNSNASINIPVQTHTGETKILKIKSAGNTDVKFDGTVESQYIIPKYKIIKKKEELVFDWSGLELNTIYDYNNKGLISYFESKSLKITNPETAFVITNITGKSNTSDINQNLQSLTGDFEMKVDSMQIDSADDNMNINTLKFSGYSKADQNKFHMGMKLIGEQMVVNENKFGPLIYDFVIRDIDKATWIKLQETANTMKGNENSMEQGMQMMGILPQLVKHSPVIEIKELSLKSDMGNLDASAKVKINGDKPELLSNLLLMGNAIEAETSVIASKRLVEYYLDKTAVQTDPQYNLQTDNNQMSNSKELNQDFIEGEMAEKLPVKQPKLDKRTKLLQLLDKNYITSDDKNFIFKATLKAGQVTVNGNPLALTPMMLQ